MESLSFLTMADNESSSSRSKEENPSEDSTSGSEEENPSQDSTSGSKEENPSQDSTSGCKEENPSSSGSKEENTTKMIIERYRASLNLLHKFWETQPVVQYKDLVEKSRLQEGPIEQPTPLSEVRQEPYRLPDAYEWTTCDMGSDEVCDEVCLLLKNYYVANEAYNFRFNFSKEFLRWALRPHGYFPSWHIGVRAKSSKILVAFIAAIPIEVGMKERNEVVQMAEVNFLCVHKKLRSKRLAPMMIREITRRIHLEDVWQAAYTAARLLPTPLTICQHWHRQLNPRKLVNVGFSNLGERMTMSRSIKLHKLPDSTSTPGLRKMEPKDVPSVTLLLSNYLNQFAIGAILDLEQVEHWLLPQEDVVETHVVEDSETHQITDFFSFYAIPCSVLNNPTYDTLKIAYSFYSASTKTPWDKLMQDALIIAKEKDFDVFSALDAMENKQFLTKLKFEKGNGKLFYYLYNYCFRKALLPEQLGLLLVES